MHSVVATRPVLPRSWRHPVFTLRNYWVALFAILVALLLARLASPLLARTDLFFDEAQYWLWSRELEFGYFSKPPLIAWIIRLATEICGNGEWCVRAASPILYTLTPVFVFLAARRLYDERIAFWSGIGFATLPGTALSSLIISTDVPLLLCWSIAFYGWVRLVERRDMADALLVGLALGAGLLAKYAALYFVLCAAVDAFTDRRAREALSDGRGFVIVGVALAVVTPNLAWNATHGFATVSHTAANASWSTLPIHVGSALEFLASQFAVFGPILFAAFLVVALRIFRQGGDEPARRLLIFSAPVLVLIVMQALLSRAHANWAAVAYPTATILVTASLLRHRPRLFRISFGLHLAAAMLITVGPLFAPHLTQLLGPERSPYARVLGWRELAETTERLAAERGARTVLTDTREVAAELLYYLRGSALPIFIWPRGGAPRNHFEMTHPFDARTPGPLLYVPINRGSTAVPGSFRSSVPLATIGFPPAAPVRDVRFYLLKGYRHENRH